MSRSASVPAFDQPVLAPAPDPDANDESLRPSPGWRPSELVGRLTELSSAAATASLTVAVDLIWQVQKLDEPVAWIARQSSSPFPVDLEATGIDLSALPVVRVADTRTAARAAERLLRSGGFGLVVLDLGDDSRLPPALGTRLLGLARKHRAAVLFLTDKPHEAPSIAPLVSLRLSSRRTRLDTDRFEVCTEALKDKRRGPGWTHVDLYRGPAGLH